MQHICFHHPLLPSPSQRPENFNFFFFFVFAFSVSTWTEWERKRKNQAGEWAHKQAMKIACQLVIIIMLMFQQFMYILFHWVSLSEKFLVFILKWILSSLFFLFWTTLKMFFKREGAAIFISFRKWNWKWYKCTMVFECQHYTPNSFTSGEWQRHDKEGVFFLFISTRPPSINIYSGKDEKTKNKKLFRSRVD